MGSRVSRRRLLQAAFGLALACRGSAARAQGNGGEFRFGLTPVFLSSDQELLSLLKSYLEVRLGTSVRLVTRRTYQEITSLLLSGQIEAAWICGYPYVVNSARLSLVAVPLWQGKPLYRSYLICGRERAASSLDDLGGDIHAFSDPDSNSGYLATASALARVGRTPDQFFSRSIFTYGHRNVVRAVAAGLTQSGSVDGYVYEVMRRTDPDLIGRTRVVQRSAWLGFPPVACAGSLAATPMVERLREALVAMPADEDGRRALALLGLDGFAVERPSLYDSIAEEVEVVRGLSG